MPVDLLALPDEMASPRPPRTGRWCLAVLVGSLLSAGLVLLLWPQAWAEFRLWFWCCTLVLPSMGGLALYALRLRAFEDQREYAQSWNLHREQQRALLIERGQRPVEALAFSYCSPAGNNQLAQALWKGAKPLQAIFVEPLALTMRLSQLRPWVRDFTVEEYAQRLADCLGRLMPGLDEDLQRYAGNAPLRLRIRHNQVLSDAEVLSLWQAARGGKGTVDEVVFATEAEDGLLWLDAWLDAPEAFPLVLSLEINLFREPVEGQAESVSAVLLALPAWCARRAVKPMASVHRPVRLLNAANSLDEVLRWGRLEDAGDQVFFTWQSQLSGAVREEVRTAMNALGYSLGEERSHPLDDSLGLPGCAVGNMALIVACEQAACSDQAQLLLLQDASPHGCVIQPIR